MKTYSNNLCVMPFIHLSSKPSGAARLCCLSKKAIKDEKGQQVFLHEGSLQEVWNGSCLKQVRLDMLNGKKLPECQNCWNEEKNGKRSKRIRENDKFLDKNLKSLEEAKTQNGAISSTPKYLDLRLGNKCNLKCRTCNPLFSSLWNKELKKQQTDMLKIPVLKTTYAGDFYSSNDMTNWYETDSFFEKIKDMSKDLEVIYISGGEPFLIKQQHKFIDYLMSVDVHKNITVRMNSNMTVLDRDLLKKLKHFKHCQFGASIDACGDKNDWMRSPSQFHKISENMKEILLFSKNWEFEINCTVSVYNVLYLDELIDWSRALSNQLNLPDFPVFFDMLHQPEFQHISVLPSALKQKAIDKLIQIKSTQTIFKSEKRDIDSCIDELKASYEDNEQINNLRGQLNKHTLTLDNWRKEDFFKVFPDFKGHL